MPVLLKNKVLLGASILIRASAFIINGNVNKVEFLA